MKRGETGNFATIFSFLFLLIIVSFGIVGASVLFFGEEIDFREMDASNLNSHIRNCILDNGFEVLENLENFYETCRINEETLDEGFAFRICTETCGDDNSDPGLLASGGDFVGCQLEGAVENRNFPRCVKRSVDIEEGLFEVLTKSDRKIRREQA